MAYLAGAPWVQLGGWDRGITHPPYTDLEADTYRAQLSVISGPKMHEIWLKKHEIWSKSMKYGQF